MKTLLQEKVSALPRRPGCYIFRNQFGTIIYIGKSKALKNRVQQYFQNVDAKEGKYKKLSLEITDLETIETPTERDALILECQLIKKHLPKYNVQLKRGKTYPYLCIDVGAEYPTISIERDNSNNHREYYGFFRNEDRAFETLVLLNDIWQTPLCGKSRFAKNHRPCLNYHLKKCSAPCSAIPDAKEYRKKIKEIRSCLSGRSGVVLRRLNRQMQEASMQLEFEQALHYRDMIVALEQLQKKARRLNTSFENRDVYLFFRGYHELGVALFYIRDGKVLARADYALEEKPQFADFVTSIRKNGNDCTTEIEQRFLTECLVAIFADKYYVPVSRHAGVETVVSKLSQAFEEFVEEGKA